MYNFRQARTPQAATTTEAHNEYAAFGIVKRHVSGCDTANMELPYGNIRNDSSAHETHDIAHTANGHHEDKGAACGKPPHYTALGRRGGPPALQPAQRQTDAGASLCPMRRFTACTLPSAINDLQREPGGRRPNATARHAKRHGPACKTARRGTTGHAHQTPPLTHAMWHRSTKYSHRLSAPWVNGKWPPALDIHQARLWHRGHGGGW